METLKLIPKVDKVLNWPQVQHLLAGHPRELVLAAVRSVLDRLRSRARQGGLPAAALAEAAVAAEIVSELSLLAAPSLKRVINGTGIVIHTNLGRSVLPEAARAALEVAFSYSNLEFDLETSGRGSRYTHVEPLLCELTGAEAALVVNNNAAAVLLALGALASGREAIVSRGELVEIGGSFRIPDVMRLSGVTLTEVGTTNRTHAKDYRQAVTPETALLMKVHRSNFSVLGFTAEVEPEEMVALGAECNLPVLVDLGSGSLIDLGRFLPYREPSVQQYIEAGVDVVTFSGDKLLGGPQAGIIVGKKALVEPMKMHPLLRAVRMDKLTLATLEATLALYRDQRNALQEIPTLRMLTEPVAAIAERGTGLVRRLRRRLPPAVTLKMEDGVSQAGGGSLPLLELPTRLIRVTVDGLSEQEIERRLRNAAVPVLGRISKGGYLLDPRTLLDRDLDDLAAALATLAG
ncbi:L-seryl-tRNA(Sec) selenium transferase [Geomesophilobacter sediminis]|uniref:L-seryl-tRNA(Sec) selenium transferase n=1 Tax=Geomesophilobacter sediminis TaxID=2798584 RepID=A0A8J7IXS4_9BACT|nr:L-seryl-tRNA(Sec) selenium transferase [Geomesophilobacter sediminis]MBJ6724787.1 L-seryl-tRNA(Sec) selenium transferase [Geomesophilobacter sediminis]